VLDWLRTGGGGTRSVDAASAHTDARRGGRTARDSADPDRDRRAKLQRRAAAFFVVTMFVAGIVAALIGKRGWFDLVENRREAAKLAESLALLQAEVASLERVVASLESDPAARERVARERLDLVKPGEIVFLLPPGAEDGGVELPPPPP
jgi:cell division protein FtsB